MMLDALHELHCEQSKTYAAVLVVLFIIQFH
jgi:hypothetical protein